MKKRFNGIHWLLGTITVPVMLSCSGVIKKNRPYNVIFIAVDDLRPDLGCYGKTRIITPNIDRLASKGVVFERAYCQTAVCMASRASLMSGLYSSSNRIYSCLSLEELSPGVETINKLFQNNGYDIYAIGKVYHHEADHLAQFGENWINTDERISAKKGYLSDEAISEINNEGRGPAWEVVDVEDDEYSDGRTAQWVSCKLESLGKSEKPFFMAVGFTRPHLPFNAPEKFWNLYDHADIPLTNIPEYPSNGSFYGYHNSPEIRHYINIPEGNEKIPDSTARMLKHGYYACISYIDAQVGKILDALKKSKLMDHTIIVLWGDHGWKFGDHGMWCKHTNFELDTHAPLIISAPGYAKNAKASSFIEFVDIYPTLVDLCDLEKPRHLQGKSYIRVLGNPAIRIKDAAYSIWPSYKAPRTDPTKVILGFSVRTDQYRYTEWIHIASGEILDKELFDHATDPDETRNIVNDPKYAGDLPRVETLIRNYRNLYSANLQTPTIQ